MSSTWFRLAGVGMAMMAAKALSYPSGPPKVTQDLRFHLPHTCPISSFPSFYIQCMHWICSTWVAHVADRCEHGTTPGMTLREPWSLAEGGNCGKSWIWGGWKNLEEMHTHNKITTTITITSLRASWENLLFLLPFYLLSNSFFLQ